jgi:hypothetical protein
MEHQAENQKWEYKILILREQPDPEVMVKDLSRMGNEGWEAVSMTPKFVAPAYLVLLRKRLQT